MWTEMNFGWSTSEPSRSRIFNFAKTLWTGFSWKVSNIDSKRAADRCRWVNRQLDQPTSHFTSADTPVRLEHMGEKPPPTSGASCLSASEKSCGVLVCSEAGKGRSRHFPSPVNTPLCPYVLVPMSRSSVYFHTMITCFKLTCQQKFIIQVI